MTPRTRSLATSAAAGLVVTVVVFLVALGALREAAPDPPALPVRFPEGALHGFLLLRSADGAELASGDQLVDLHDGVVESRMVFRFPDGSLHDERVSFTQDSVFRLRRYQLHQRGAAFPMNVGIQLDGATGWYRVSARKANGDLETDEDTLDLPPDTYNGMMLIVAKNLPAGVGRRVHYVAFTPKPQLIELEVAPAGTDSVRLGSAALPAAHLVLKPRLGAIRQAFATLLGRDPPDNHLWMVTRGVPGFVRFDGPLYPEGPIWRIELAAPQLGGRAGEREGVR